MSSKDTPDNPKHRLLDDLKSIKGVLDEGDDNIPLLDDAEADIPVLADDDDIPVLGDVEAEADAKNKASLQAALKELESLELSPKSSRSRAAIDPDKIPNLEDKIRASAAPPLVKLDQPASKENPFLTKKPQDKFEASRKQAEAALQSVIAHSRAMGGKTAPPPKKEPEKAATLTVKDDPSATPVDFTPAAKAAPVAKAPTTQEPVTPEATDGADDILKMLGESKPVIRKGGAQNSNELEGAFDALVDIDLDDLGEMDVNDDSMPELPTAKKVAATAPGSLTEKEFDALIDEIIEECSAAFNIMLEKKLKEKLSRLLKK